MSSGQFKILLGLGFFTAVVIVLVVYAFTISGKTAVRREPKLQPPQPTVTETLINPFSEEASYQNPFEIEEGYQNPFEATVSAEENQPYENPFEVFR